MWVKFPTEKRIFTYLLYVSISISIWSYKVFCGLPKFLCRRRSRAFSWIRRTKTSALHSSWRLRSAIQI